MANWKNIIAEIREQTGWTLDEISEETGIAQGYLSQLQTGKRNNPSSDVIERLAHGLGVPVGALYGEVPLRVGEFDKEALGIQDLDDVRTGEGEGERRERVRSSGGEVRERGEVERVWVQRENRILRRAMGNIEREITRGKRLSSLASMVPSPMEMRDHGKVDEEDEEDVGGVKPRILVVEDDAPTSEILVKLLEAKRYHPRVALSGQEALDLLHSDMPPAELVLLDLMMPDIDGFEICSHMQAHEVLRQIPVIMVTARIDQDSIVHGLELGAADYVVKPFHNRELLARIQSVLRWKSF